MRLIAFAGDEVDLGGYPAEALRSQPPLPEGLTIDAQNGHLVGAARSPSPGQLYWLFDDVDRWPLYLEIVRRPRAGDRFVAPDGNDTSDGSIDHPFKTIARAIEGVTAGTTIFLRTGRYAEDVTLRGLIGESDAPITLRAYPGDHVTIEGERIAVDWVPARDDGAAPNEWVSSRAYPFKRPEDAANRGVFFDRTPYTRLLTYSRLEDLRARNQLWKWDSDLPGPHVTDGHQRPWAYFGPGLWHDSTTGLIHLRLSPTTNHVKELADFEGPTDPTHTELGVWFRSSTPLTIVGSSNVEIRDLAIVGGGETSVRLTHASDIVLDHVDIRAGSMALEVSQSTRVRFVHGHVDGGIPPWTFRSDFKDSYKFALDGRTVGNDLIRKTSNALLYIADGNREIEIAYSELENAHDNIIGGIRSELHHCLIRNVHDDAVFINHTNDIDDLRIHDNVFERILTTFSSEGRHATGARYVYRNIFDLREPTGGSRPGLFDEVWRWGWIFKGDYSLGPMYFYQNTILQARAGEQSTSMLFRALEPNGNAVHPRWFLNNIVAVDNSIVDRQLSWIPDESYRKSTTRDGMPVLRSDGNVWLRTGTPMTPMFRCLSLGRPCRTREWNSLEEVRETGFEVHSHVATDALFVRLDSLTSKSSEDNLRPSPLGPAVGSGIALPSLPDSEPPNDHPDVGALPASSSLRRIGVDGRLGY